MSSIDFIDCIVEIFPFRIQTVRTDRGHEWQVIFHWHVDDTGAVASTSNPEPRIKTARPKGPSGLIRKISTSFLTYTDDVDLNAMLAACEEFCNMNRPHGPHGGMIPYYALRSMPG